MQQRAILCHRCRRLIGSDETVCSWCGAARPSGISLAAARVLGTFDGDWLIKSIITLNIALYILSLLYSTRRGSGMNPLSFMSPDQTSLLVLGATGTIPIDRFGRFWSVITANYLHGGILHLVFNMMAVRQIAPWVSKEFGSGRMFSIYTMGGVCGFWVSYVAGVPFTIGASAAVCSLIGALLYFGKSRGGSYGAAVYREVGGWAVGLALFGLMMPGINNWGHGGGIVGGAILAMLLGYEDQGRENSFHRGVFLLCAITTVGVVGWAIISSILLRFAQ